MVFFNSSVNEKSKVLWRKLVELTIVFIDEYF